jgi:acetyl esterase/lipase
MIDKKLLDPSLRFIADRGDDLALYGNISLDDIRRNEPVTYVENPDMISVRDEFVDADGYRLRVRIYEPKNRSGAKVGALYWIHGGGMALGSPETDDAICARFALACNVLVASVDYRLAPENPYPIPLWDCHAGLLWLFDTADELGIDRERVAIGGASSGGNLCAALTLLLRDNGGPKLIFQMPLYPMIDDRMETDSEKSFTADFIPFAWNRDNNKVAWNWYLKNVDRNNVPIYAAPARAKDLSNLPPAYSCVGEFDPFIDETIDYFSRLQKSDVSAELRIYKGAFHGFDQTSIGSELGEKAIDENINALRKAFECC